VTADVEEANTVADAIKALIVQNLHQYPSVKSLILVGHDDIIPFHRVGDSVTVSPESDYLNDAHVSATSPLGKALARNYYLTDDFYASLTDYPFLGRRLLMPELAIGRLVESPTDIQSAIDSYLATDGEVVTTAVVAGSQFLKDGAASVATLVRQFGATSVDDSRISDTWSAASLQSGLLGGRKDLVVLASHFVHNAVLAPDGSRLASDAIRDSSISYRGTLVLTIGCHSGLNVPDVDSGASADGLELSRRSPPEFARFADQPRRIYPRGVRPRAP